MEKSLCGRYPCPELCVRACHCLAGHQRSAWLLAQQRNKRLVVRHGFRGAGVRIPSPQPETPAGSQSRPSSDRPVPRGVNPHTEEISRPRHYLAHARETILYNLFGAEKYPQHHKPTSSGLMAKHPILAWLIITLIVALLGLVLLNGTIAPSEYDSSQAKIGETYHYDFWQEK